MSACISAPLSRGDDASAENCVRRRHFVNSGDGREDASHFSRLNYLASSDTHRPFLRVKNTRDLLIIWKRSTHVQPLQEKKRLILKISTTGGDNHDEIEGWWCARKISRSERLLSDYYRGDICPFAFALKFPAASFPSICTHATDKRFILILPFLLPSHSSFLLAH